MKAKSVGAFALSLVLFGICLVAYMIGAHLRHQENPDDKVMPTLYQVGEAFCRSVTDLDKNGERPLFVDTIASAKRFGLSILMLCGAVLLGLHMGVFPFMRALLLRFVLFFDKIPALCLLPILFILFGLDEASKIALIVIGVAPTIILDTFNMVEELPREQFVTAQTLKASSFEVVYSIVLPQILPNVLNSVRLNLKAVMLFLITGEALAASAGLGYRIFVVRRYMAMDKIIAYAIWMSLLLFLVDLGLRIWIKKRYPWVTE